MSHEPLEESALEWLRYERGCYVLALERGLDLRYRPDVLGVNRKLFLLEIEIKRTLADLRANGRKRDKRIVEPRQRWFMVPRSLVALVQPILPTGWGLLTLRSGGIPTPSGLPDVDVVFPAPTRQTRPLKAFEVAKMVRHQSGTLVSVAASAHKWRKYIDETKQKEMFECMGCQEIKPRYAFADNPAVPGLCLACDLLLKNDRS